MYFRLDLNCSNAIFGDLAFDQMWGLILYTFSSASMTSSKCLLECNSEPECLAYFYDLKFRSCYLLTIPVREIRQFLIGYIGGPRGCSLTLDPCVNLLSNY